LHRGHPLSPEQKISEINNLNTGDELHIVKFEPSRPEPRSPSPVRQNGQNEISLSNRATPYSRHGTNSNTRFNKCAILYRNFKACVQASVRSENPADRIRYNTPEVESPVEPKVVDLGNHIKIMATTVRNWALELHKLSDKLIQDPELRVGTQEREELRRKRSEKNGKYIIIMSCDSYFCRTF